MQKPTITFQQIQILFLAMLAGQVIIGCILFFLQQEDPARTVAEPPFHLVIPVVVVVGIIASQWLHRQHRANPLTQGSLSEKLAHYRNHLVRKAAVAEGVNLLALVLVFLFGDLTSFVWFGVGVLMFAYLRPTLERFATDYQVSASEREQLSELK